MRRLQRILRIFRQSSTVFDGRKWKWKGAEPRVGNSVNGYLKSMKTDVRRKFDDEIERWISEGILKPWSGDSTYGVIPLMAVEQINKNKVGPVLDFRKLNEHVSCHSGDEVNVCDESIKSWRRINGGRKVVDLKTAYLQIHVDESLWKHQLVSFKGKIFCLTRVGFGLCRAPRIMTKIFRVVLEQNDVINRGTASYMDDILVNEDVVSAELLEVTYLCLGWNQRMWRM